MTRKGLSLILSALMITMLAGSLEAYPLRDSSLIPVPVTGLVPFAPLEETGTYYLPSEWKSEQKGQSLWTFSAGTGSAPAPLSAEIRTGRDFRTWKEYADSLLSMGEQQRIVGPIGFPDKFDDTRERWIIHFIRDGRMLTAIYGSVTDVRRETATALEMVFPTDDLDYFDSLSYAVICNVSAPGRKDIREVQCYRKCIAIDERTGLKVPLSRRTPEDAVTSYYGCLITNRWEKARSFLSRTVDVWPQCFDIAYKERCWWALKWFKPLFTRHFEDRVECAVMKGVRQVDENQNGVDYVTMKKKGQEWSIVSFP